MVRIAGKIGNQGSDWFELDDGSKAVKVIVTSGTIMLNWIIGGRHSV